MAGTVEWYLYSREVVYNCRLNAGGTYYYKQFKYYRPVVESRTPITRASVTVSYGGSTSTTGVFNAGSYNTTEVKCSDAGKPTYGMYYTNSNCNTEISGLNKIYGREDGDTDSSKWGGYNEGKGIYVYTGYYPNSYWDSKDFSSYTFPASGELSMTAYKPSSGYSSCGSYKVTGDKFSRTVYVTFPSKADYQRITGSTANLTGGKCRSGSTRYSGNTYGAGQKVTVYGPGTYKFYPIFSASGIMGRVVLNAMGGTNSTHDMTDGGSIGLKHGIEWCRSSAGNTVISSIPVPTRAGYVFNGYYTGETNGTLMIDEIGDIQASVTFRDDNYDAKSVIATWYAHGTPLNYALTANINNTTASGGTISGTTGGNVNSDGLTATKTVPAGNEYGTLPSVGYNTTKGSFKGYSATSSGSEVTSSTPMPAGDTTIYGRGTRIGTTVQYNKNDGSGTTVESDLKYGASYSFPSGSRSGYTLKGGYTAETGGSSVGTKVPSNAADPYKVFAQGTKNSIIVRANANSGTIPTTSGGTGSGSTATKTVNLNDTIGTLPMPTRSGYKFKGWFTSTTSTTQVNPTDKITDASATYYDIYAQGTTDITLTLSDTGKTLIMKVGKSNNSTVAAGTSGRVPTSSGLIFNGGGTTASGTGTQVYTYEDDGSLKAVTGTSYFDSSSCWIYNNDLIVYARGRTPYCGAYNSGGKPVRNVGVRNGTTGVKLSKFGGYNSGGKPNTNGRSLK